MIIGCGLGGGERDDFLDEWGSGDDNDHCKGRRGQSRNLHLYQYILYSTLLITIIPFNY
jgi:hypothetical protein